MKASELRKINENSFKVWFEKWYQESNIEERMKKAAEEGFKGIEIDVHNQSDATKKRFMQKDEMVAALKEKLPDFTIKRDAGNDKIKTVFGDMRKYKNIITISWGE